MKSSLKLGESKTYKGHSRSTSNPKEGFTASLDTNAKDFKKHKQVIVLSLLATSQVQVNQNKSSLRNNMNLEIAPPQGLNSHQIMTRNSFSSKNFNGSQLPKFSMVSNFLKRTNYSNLILKQHQ